MTLEELFIKVAYKLDTSGLERAKKGTKELEENVDDVSQSIEGLQKALNVLTGVAVAGATAGTYAYQRWSRSMVELSGKAGLTLKQFKELTKTSAQISSHTGLGESFIREMQQRAFSLGADRRTASRLAHMASVLHVTRQAIGTDAVEAAMALQGSNLGRAIPNLQMVHAASQVGGGNVPDYFAAATTLAASAGPAGVNIQDLLAMLTIGSRGGSLSGAAAGIDQFLLALKREPEKKRGEFYQKITGRDWTNMDRILQEQGMVGLIRHIDEAFEDEDVFKLFGEKEAIKTVALLKGAVDDLSKNRESIATAVDRDTIGAFDTDTYREFSRKFDRFTSTLGRFMEAYGEPFAKTIGLFLDAITSLINGIIELNRMMGGLLAWVPALLTGGLLAFKTSLPALLVGLMGNPTWLDRLKKKGQPKASMFDRARDYAKGTKTGSRGVYPEEMFGTVPAAAAGAGIGGMFSGMFRRMLSSFFVVFDYLRAFISGDPQKYHGIHGQVGNSAATRSLRVSAKILAFPVVAVLGVAVKYLAGIFAILGGFLLGASIWSKIRKWDATEELNAARGRDAQADYFRRQGMPGGEPAPGSADIAAARRMQAEAERDLLQAEVDSRLSQIYQMIYAKLKEYLPQELLDIWEGIIDFFSMIFGGIDSLFTALGTFVRQFFADPRAALGMLWDTWWRKDAEIESWFMKKFLESTGGIPEEGKALGEILDRSSSTTLAQPTIKIPRELAEQLGMTGGDYSNVTGAPNVQLIHLPIPPQGMTQQSVSNEVVINFGDINIDSQGTDRFDTAKQIQDAIRSEIRNSADYIIHEMDWASP